MGTELAWHFSDSSETLAYGDNREISIGVTHEIKPPIELCKRGLHGSINILDALRYAPGNILWRVELSGEIIFGDDKLVATHRKYLARIDAKQIFDQFARACALSVANLWEPPDVVMQFLCGDESVRAAAWDAARAAAWDAAWDATWDATRVAAWAAARAAAWDAARAATWDAARAAAWAAARATTWDAVLTEQNEILTKYVFEVMGD